MITSYMGKLLLVDLTLRTCRTLELPDWLIRDYVGGKGFGVKLLYDLTREGADPLGPNNPLMFLTGPLTATAAPSMRACVVTKSPLTGAFLDSYFGGRFGPEIKYAGYDGLVITGRAERPSYLWINDDTVEIRDAGFAWGKDALAANRLIKDELGQPDAMLASIGQAGENQVLYALVSCEFNRQAGRGGAGCVMGSKNLKAVAVKGSRTVRAYDLKAFGRTCTQANAEIAVEAECAALTGGGTSHAVDWSNEVGTLPANNFSSQVYDKAASLGYAGQDKNLFLGKAACFGCPIRCSQMGAVRTGRHAHFITDIVEYESAGLMGSNLGISDVRAVAHLVKLCDKYGLDSISMGAVIGFAFEATGKGHIEPPEGMRFEFGSVAGAEYLIKSVAQNQTSLGRLLAGGVKRAARELGGGSEAYAIHVKGMECPAWGPRGTPGMGLAYMTADRGACHQRGFMISYELGGMEYEGKPVEAHSLENKAAMLKGLQDYSAGTDCLVKCDFGSFGISPASYAAMLSAATGRKVEAGFFSALGERVWNMTRLFNLREGFEARHDRLPRRFVEEPLPSGPHAGQRISGKDMAYMLADYYAQRGWDQKGEPIPETLGRLGLTGKEKLSVD